MSLRIGLGIGLPPPSREGVGVPLETWLAAVSGGFDFDATKLDRFFQENIGPTLADDVGEAIGLAMDQRTWAGKTLAEVIAAASELVTNGGFDSDTVWTKGANWTIAGGKATKTGGAANNLTDSTAVAVAGRTYRVEFTISNYGGSGALTPTMGANGTARVANGTYVEYITATGATAFALAGGTSFSGDVDNVSVKHIPGNHALQSNGTLKPVRQAAGLKGDGSDDNLLPPYLVSGAAGLTLFIDAVCPASLAGDQTVLGSNGGSNDRIRLGFNTSGNFCAAVGTDTESIIKDAVDWRGQRCVAALVVSASRVKLLTGGASPAYDQARNGALCTTVAPRLFANNSSGTAGRWFGGTAKRLVLAEAAMTDAEFARFRATQLAS